MVDNVYGGVDGNSTHKQNTVVHYYDKAGVRAANRVNVYGQFADRKSMPTKMGKTYKVSKFLHIFDREDGVDADFATKGYLTARNISDVTTGLANDAALPEGAGAVNKQTIKAVTMETSLKRYGEMIDYTDEVDIFSEDQVQVQYREELGELANQRSEDLRQLDMLATTNSMYAGTAVSMETIGTDSVAGDGSTDIDSRISYDLIRRCVRKLVRNRAVRNTEIVTGSTKIGTTPVNRSFYAIIGAEVKYDLESAVRGDVASNGSTEYVYIPAYKYADASKLAEGEVGSMNDVRFIEAESAVVYRGAGAQAGAYTGTLATTTLTAGDATVLNALSGGGYSAGQTRFDAFPVLFPTKGSFATVGLKGHGKIKFNAQSPSKIEHVNPYGTAGFFSYNFWHAGIILREERLLKALVCASE